MARASPRRSSSTRPLISSRFSRKPSEARRDEARFRGRRRGGLRGRSLELRLRAPAVSSPSRSRAGPRAGAGDGRSLLARQLEVRQRSRDRVYEGPGGGPFEQRRPTDLLRRKGRLAAREARGHEDGLDPEEPSEEG